MEDVTVIILTKNESINIHDCIKSTQDFAKRIVVIDSNSDDDTCDISRELGAEVYTHPFENYARQFNWALDNVEIETRWTFRLDADERLTQELCKELSLLIKRHENDNVNGIVMEAWLYFMGRKIKHGGSQKRKMMLFKTGIGRIEDRKMDEHTILLYGTTVSCAQKFKHYDFKDMTFWINKLNWYATREVQDYFEYINGKRNVIQGNDNEIATTRNKKFGLYYKFPMFIRCWMLFIYTYIFQLGFLDGKEGFIYHWMYHRWYRTLVDCKILEQGKTNKSFEEIRDLE